MPEKITIGNADLWFGDCAEVLPAIGRFDLILTDPPYGAGYASNPIHGKYGNHEDHEWDGKQFEGLDKVRESGIIQIIWGGNYYVLPPSRCWLSWYKPDSVPSMASLELAWTNLNQNARQISHTIAATNAERAGHVTQKPVRVMAWCLDQARNVQTVCDPFMGSGTTGVACAQMGKTFTGIEQDRKYFDIACARIDRAQRQGKLFEPEKPVLMTQTTMAFGDV